MCYENRDLNKVQVCTVGDLKPGDQYRTPDGKTLLVTDTTPNVVVDIETGATNQADPTTKLGRDRAGRLYASRFLNQPQPPPAMKIEWPDPVVDVSTTMKGPGE